MIVGAVQGLGGWWHGCLLENFMGFEIFGFFVVMVCSLVFDAADVLKKCKLWGLLFAVVDLFKN